MKTKMLKKLTLASLSLLVLTACSKEEVVFHNVSSTDTAGVATGDAVDFTDASIAEQTNAIAALEGYVMDNMMAGIPLFENAAYQMIRSDVTIGTASKYYIPSFGFGILTNGEITSDLPGESTEAWKRYYHTYISTDYKTINYWDSAYSTTSTFSSYVHMAYYSATMNSTQNGFSYEPFAATTGIQFLDENGNYDQSLTKSSKFRFEVRVGDDLKYNTLSKNSTFSKYKDQEVALEDYLTTYKELYNQKNSLYRGSQSLDSASSIKGLREYYDATANGFDQTAWDNVGVKAVTDGGKSYLEIELCAPVTEFFAKYYTSSSLFAPIPASFITDVGGMKMYGGFGTDNSVTPVDTTLATGPYVCEEYTAGSHVVFKFNENFPNVKNEGNYSNASAASINSYEKTAGVHYNVLEAAQSSTEAAWNEYQADKLHLVSIPTTKLTEFQGHAESHRAMGSVTYKLYVNGCDETEWEDLFGTHGTFKQTALEDYWEVEPALSNNDFLKGLYFSINREAYAAELGQAPSGLLFGDAYLNDPENSTSYNSTSQHKAVMNNTDWAVDTYGYSETASQAYFKTAYETLISEGYYKNGDTINIELCFSTTNTATNYGTSLKQYFEKCGNYSGAPLKLNVNVVAAASSSTYTSDKITSGQSDFTFGAISGSTFDPLDYFDLFCSDNRSGFLRNFGFDSTKNDGTLKYNGETYSYDALWGAFKTPGGVNLLNGEVKPVDFDAVLQKSLHNDEDDFRSVVISVALAAGYEVTGVALVGTKDGKSVTLDFTGSYSSTTNLISFTLDEDEKDYFDGTVTIKITYKDTDDKSHVYDVKTNFVK